MVSASGSVNGTARAVAGCHARESCPLRYGTSELPDGPEEAHVRGYPRGATVADSPPRVGRRLRAFSPLKERSAEPGARDRSLPGNGRIGHLRSKW